MYYILNLFKKSKTEKNINYINVGENFIEFDGTCLSFPLALSDISPVLGAFKEAVHISHNEKTTSYIFHSQGVVFQTCDEKCMFLKSKKAFTDDSHNITSCYLYYGNRVKSMWGETALPKSVCTAVLCFNRKPVKNSFTFDNRAEIGSVSAILWSNNETSVFKENGQPNATISLSYTPKRPPDGVSYKITDCFEELLEFDNFNFKLAILQVLIYDLELLVPYFDIYEFAEQFGSKEIDTESETPIKAIVDYFKQLPVPKRFADNITELYMDGGNDIYMNIAPLWNGEDDYFDINEISIKELLQFPNLKKTTIMSSEYEKVSAVFNQVGIKTQTL